MNAKKFSDALSALDGRYVEEAARYRRKHGQSFWGPVGRRGGLPVPAGRRRGTADSGQRARCPGSSAGSNPESHPHSRVRRRDGSISGLQGPCAGERGGGVLRVHLRWVPHHGTGGLCGRLPVSIQYGSGDISGIYGGTLEESREIAGVSVAYYQYDSMSYAIWEANGFACSYLYTNGGDAEVDLLIQQGP